MAIHKEDLVDLSIPSRKDKKVRIVLTIVSVSLIYGLLQASFGKDSFLISVVSSTCIPLIMITVLTLIIEVIRTLVKKGYMFRNFLRTAWIASIPVFILCYAMLGLDLYYGPVTNGGNSSISLPEGVIDSLDNENHYINYNYLYSLNFPLEYDVDRTRQPEVTASDSNTGNIIAINIRFVELGDSLVNSKTKDELSEIMVREVFKKFDQDDYLRNLELGYEQIGLDDVSYRSSELTIFNERHFINAILSGNIQLDDASYPVTLRNFTSFYNGHVYQFVFRNFETEDQSDIEETVTRVMKSLVIDEDTFIGG